MADKKRIHPSFSMTGRSTVAKPEMQRLPLRTEEARKIRDALMPAPPILGPDYETLELRILAQMREQGVTVDQEWIQERMREQTQGEEMQEVTPEDPSPESQ